MCCSGWPSCFSSCLTAPPRNRWNFYDESEEVLFEAPAGSIPPIRGINDNVVDGVRAIVIAPKAKPDASARRIAYLEKWSSQLETTARGRRKAKETALRRQTSSIVRNFHRFVRTVDSPKWHSTNTDQAADHCGVVNQRQSGETPRGALRITDPARHPGFWCRP